MYIGVFLMSVFPRLGVILCLTNPASSKPMTCLKESQLLKFNSQLEESDTLKREDMSRVGDTHAQWPSYNAPCCVSLINPTSTYTSINPVATLLTYSAYSLFSKFAFRTGDSKICFGKMIGVGDPC